MVASLQSKKEALEAKLRDKTRELKRLCLEEAELTGILPAETPLEPGESPPHFRRRVGTTFSYPENLIDQLQSKEVDKAIASLELDCKIQTGIAEAALGIANDGSTSKSVRRKHKVIYQESQRRLFELETQLNSLKQNQSRQHKKIGHSPSESEFDCTDSEERDNNSNLRHAILSHSLSDQGVPVMRHFHTFGSLPRHETLVYNQNYRTMQCYPMLSGNYYSNAGISAGINHKICGVPHNHNYQQYVHSLSQLPAVHQGWQKGREFFSTEHPTNTSRFTVDHVDPSYHMRTTPIEQNGQWISYNGKERVSSTLPRNISTPANSVLLPGQTYPDNSLMRTQSLGNVATFHHIPPDKKKEKEWYETSLDSSPAPSRVSKVESPISVDQQPFDTVDSKSDKPVEIDESNAENVKTHHALINNIQFDTVVPYESPKNHTVIEAGKWQPYREVTKPFEMSDFYKYSTKFRKGKTSPASSTSHQNDRASHQQKVVYKPLKPQECQALSNKSINCDGRNTFPPDILRDTSSSPEAAPWFTDKRPINTASATIV